MPIRTNRGRAAVYRRLWGWPMRSPRHLTILVFVVAVLVLAVGITIPQLTNSGDKPTGGAAAETSGSSTTKPGTSGGTANTPGSAGSTSSLPTRITSPPVTPKTATPKPAALSVAEKWAKAWVNHPAGITNAKWLEGLAPYTDEEYLNTEMTSVEPANIGATKITGDPEPVESYTSSVKVKLATDDGDLLITVIDTPDGWRVNYYEQVS